jgi:Fur family transcriptional regulator, zinc uptake regulator
MRDQDDTRPPAPMTLGGRLSKRRAPTVPATALDQAILTLLTRSEMPLSAYELTERLREQGRRVVPMSVYRSLDRLSARDLVHKVEMLSAFRAKSDPQPILMICIQCGSTQSLAAPDLHGALEASLASSGFTPRRVAFEVAGFCSTCRRQSQS